MIRLKPNSMQTVALTHSLVTFQRLETKQNPQKLALVLWFATPTYFRYLPKVEALKNEVIEYSIGPPLMNYPLERIISAAQTEKTQLFFHRHSQ